MANILIVDDEPSFSSGLADYMRLQNHVVVTANSLSTARELLQKRVPDVLLLDLMLPDGSGLELFDAFDSARPRQIVIITGHSGVKSLIGGMAGDGVTYMKKPIEPQDLIGMLNAVDTGTASDIDDDDNGLGNLRGSSDAMREVFDQIRQVAPTDSTVFIQGESGTGKELVAEAVHRLSGLGGSFVPVNCGGLSKDLVSSQLFGHEKGSFTGANRRHAGFFERANNGTLFLDEVTEMPIEMQTHLLRVLESNRILRVGAESEIKVNARLIAATNRDPAKAVRNGDLREDLYFRLRVFPIELPPLRSRRGDVALLAEQFIGQLNEKNGTEKRFTLEALRALDAHNWPGNVRELKHTVHRAYILSNSDDVEAPRKFDDDLTGEFEGLTVGRSIADVEKDLIYATLEQHQGDKKAAASSLGISLKTLYNRLRDYEDQNG
jgi:DNA-binding NtrC family response regulator